MKNRFLDGLALGILLGFVASTISLWLVGSTTEVVRQFSREQLTHFFTLAAAGLALWGVSGQIQSNFELSEKRRRAKLDAAISCLPIVLSNISEICAIRVDKIVRGEKTPPRDKHWEISDFELSTLRSCNEHAEGVEKKRMQEVIRIYQVLIARWKDANWDKLASLDYIESGNYKFVGLLEQFHALQGWLTLQVINDSLFYFARGQSAVETEEEMRNSVVSRLRRLGLEGGSSKSGWSLMNNQNYKEFLERLSENQVARFINAEWL